MTDDDLLETLRSALGSDLRRANELFTHPKLNGLLDPLLVAAAPGQPIESLRQRTLQLAVEQGWFVPEEPASRRSFRLTSTGAAAL